MSTVTIEAAELDEIGRLLYFCGATEDRPELGFVQVAPTRHGLRWSATDGSRVASLRRGFGDLDRPALIPVSLLDFAHRAVSRCGSPTVRFEFDRADHEVTMVLPELRVPRFSPDVDFPDIDAMFDAAPSHTPSTVVLQVESLRGAVHAATTFNGTVCDLQQTQPLALRTNSSGELVLISPWKDTSDGVAFIPVTADGPVDTVVDALQLLHLIGSAGEDELTLVAGAASDPVRVRTTDGFQGLIPPLRLGQNDLERAAAEFLNKPHADLLVDHDGSVSIQWKDVELRVHLVGGDVFGRGALARISSVAATGIPATPELLAELNELNHHARLCRLVHIDDEVQISGEKLLETIDPRDIRAISREIVDHARAFGPLLTAVHR